MSTLNTNNTKSKHHRFLPKYFKPYMSFFNRRRGKSDTKKINLFSILFSSLLCMRKPSFLKDSSLLCTYSSSCPLPHKNITFCRSKTKKVGPILTKIVQEWDSFKSGSVLRFTFIFLAFFSFKRGKRSSLDLIFGIFR